MGWLWVDPAIATTGQVAVTTPSAVAVTVPPVGDYVVGQSGLTPVASYVATNGALAAPSGIGNLPFDWSVFTALLGWLLGLFVISVAVGAVASALRG